ncbi:MAG: hypothetical protein E7Z79_01295 [Methanobrevibacter thaueri]|uniref:Alpha/beta hydrolase family protein n=1 Tax=Methanobrevibacter thaueri TaxID=190975 RepID=A0A8T3VAS0_9EURY|nr:YqiA/YcfP family alpha/beta fold hydrolase [Methanobrevibacter thaueri]MBE6501057.1 hypothetical protein [Methanobrevibacter thaueri]
MTNKRFELTDEIIETADYGMHKLIDKNIKLNFDEISSFEFPLDEPFGLQVVYNNTIHCLVVKFSSKNKNLICTGPGAHERDIIRNGELFKPPYIDRWSWYTFFDESFIAYADPMFFYGEKIKIAWLIGTKEHWFLEDLSKIIEELCKNQEIRHDNILFCGSSGGGYTSVVLGTLIKNSQVLINNSQLFVMNYWESMVNPLFDVLYDSFVGMTKDEIVEKIKHRLDLIELFKKENYAPFITYYVNAESEWDIKLHGMPFLKQIYKLKQFNGLEVVYYREIKDVPHEPMDPKKTVKVIKEYCKNYLYNTGETKIRTENQNIYIEGKYISQLEKQNKKLKKKNKKLKKENKELLNSTSWKITSPLRKIKRYLKKIKIK